MKIKAKQSAQPEHAENAGGSITEVATTPECLSASILTLFQKIDPAQINNMVAELKRQTAAVHRDDLSRAESMLVAQAHTLDGLFARLTSNAFTTNNLEAMERYMRLALKAQAQARATLQTLAELKAPRQVAFVTQANIGNQLQVNNGCGMRARARTRENENEQNELLEVPHGERLDTRAASTTGCDDSSMATMVDEHWPYQR